MKPEEETTPTIPGEGRRRRCVLDAGVTFALDGHGGIGVHRHQIDFHDEFHDELPLIVVGGEVLHDLADVQPALPTVVDHVAAFARELEG